MLLIRFQLEKLVCSFAHAKARQKMKPHAELPELRAERPPQQLYDDPLISFVIGEGDFIRGYFLHATHIDDSFKRAVARMAERHELPRLDHPAIRRPGVVFQELGKRGPPALEGR